MGRGLSFVASKENLCYIAFEYDTELTSTAERSDCQIHMLSDGNIINVGAERFRCESISEEACGEHVLFLSKAT